MLFQPPAPPFLHPEAPPTSAKSSFMTSCCPIFPCDAMAYHHVCHGMPSYSTLDSSSQEPPRPVIRSVHAVCEIRVSLRQASSINALPVSRYPTSNQAYHLEGLSELRRCISLPRFGSKHRLRSSRTAFVRCCPSRAVATIQRGRSNSVSARCPPFACH